MLLERDRKLFFIFAAISIALSVIVCVPFAVEKVTLFEIIFKYMLAPCVIAIFTAMCFSAKYRNYRPAVKYTTLVCYTPLFSYISAILFNTILLVVRNNGIYEAGKTNIYLMGIAALLVIVIVIAIVFPKFVVLFSKNEAMIVDAIFAVLAIAYVISGCKVSFDYLEVGLKSKSIFFIILPLVFGLVLGYLHYKGLEKAKNLDEEYVSHSREELLALWKDNCKNANIIYEAARVDIVNSLFGYTLKDLGYEECDEEDDEEIVGDVVAAEEYDTLAADLNAVKDDNCALLDEINALKAKNEALQAKLNEAQAIIDASKDKIVETLQKCAENDTELIIDSLQHSLDVIVSERNAIKDSREKLIAELTAQKAELEAKIAEHNAKLEAEAKAKAEAEEKARLEAERRAQEALERAKDKKPIEPAFEAFIEYAVSVGAGRDDVEVSINDKQTLYKYSLGNKAFLSLQKTNNDYKISFLAKTDEMRTLLYQYNGIVVFDKTIDYEKSGFELQQLKASYKGDESILFDALKEIMNHSLENLLEAEKAEDDAIAAEKAAKERAKLAERALREKERQIAREEAKRLAAEQKAQEEQAKAQEESENEAPQEENNSEEEAA